MDVVSLNRNAICLTEVSPFTSFTVHNVVVREGQPSLKQLVGFAISS